MAGLEAVLRIGAKDETGAGFAQLRKEIEGFEKQIGPIDKLFQSIAKIDKVAGPMAKSVTEAQKAFNLQRDAVLRLTAGLDRLEGAGGAVGNAQARMAAEIQAATRALVAQGVEAQRAAQKVVASQNHVAHGLRGALGEALPFAGPAILHETAKATEAGATVQERIAQLKGMGAKPENIAQAQSDFREFSKTHAGVLESDYLAGYKDALTIAPQDAFGMAKHGAVFRSGLRNSGLPIGEGDVGDALRIMDELALKTDAQS